MDERLRRWRLVLGGDAADGTGAPLAGPDRRADRALADVYDAARAGGLTRSAAAVRRWLGDVRAAFPTPAVRLLQRDAVARLELGRLLLEPELAGEVEADLDLAVALLSLADGLTEAERDAARAIVARVVDGLLQALRPAVATAARGALRAGRTRRPAAGDVDWDRTIRANLRAWHPGRRALVPTRLVGRGRRARGLDEVILLVDQSGSMADSAVYAAVLGAALAAVPSVRTRLLAFDTRVVDLSEHLGDPVGLLFAAQLGGGTDLAAALARAAGLIERPARTVVLLVSDLEEGRAPGPMLAEARAIVASGARLVALLALTDRGAAAWHRPNAVAMAALGVPAFGCTPEHLPGLLAAALAGQDLHHWAAERGIDVG